MLTIQRTSQPAVREFTRNVPKTFDGGDINTNGQWRGAEVGCLECRETAAMHYGGTATYMVAQLECGECGEPFAEVRQ